MNTTERKPVDVLRVMRNDAECAMWLRREKGTPRDTHIRYMQSHAAREAFSELVIAAEFAISRYAGQVENTGEYGTAIDGLRAALVRVQGGQS